MSDTLKPLLNEIDNIISNDKECTLVKSTIIKFFNHNEKDYVKVPFKVITGLLLSLLKV